MKYYVGRIDDADLEWLEIHTKHTREDLVGFVDHPTHLISISISNSFDFWTDFSVDNVCRVQQWLSVDFQLTFNWLSIDFQLTFSWLSIDFQQWLSVDDVCRVQQWLSKRWNGARPVHCYVPWYSNIFMTSLINYIIIIMGQFVFHVFDVWIAFSDLNKGNVTGNLVFRWQIDPKSTRCNWRYQFSGFWTTTEADI